MATEGPLPLSAHPRTARLVRWMSRHLVAVVVTAVALTAALAVPLLAMAPDELASVEPDGPVFEARDALEERFDEGVIGWFFIVEARDGEILDRDGLLAVHDRLEALRTDPALADLLLPRTDPATGRQLAGAASLPDAVEGALAADGGDGLAAADEQTVRTVTTEVVDAQGPAELGLSARATRDGDGPMGRWSAPALTIDVLADGDAIEGRGNDSFGSDRAVEEVGRRVQALLRAHPDLDVWGVALDQTLTAEEQGEAAGPFIGLTVLAIVLLVGVAFRSYWTLAVVGGALVALLVWLQGLANLLGLKQDQVLSTVVPIAMIAFGVDYAFHAVGRWREERRKTPASSTALERGLAGVAPALLLALATGALAFLANTASGIESIVQFGIAAAVALGAALVVLGIVVPAALALVEQHVGRSRPPGGRLTVIAGGLGAAVTAMVAVLFTVYLAAPVGLALLATYLLAFVVAPVVLARRLGRPAPMAPTDPPEGAEGRVGAALARAVVAVAGRRALVLPAVGLVSIVAGWYAVGVPASFDVEDFFSSDTDFVVGLDKLDEHVGDQGGEPATVYVTADLDDPGAADAVEAFVERVAALETPLLARDAAGLVHVDASALEVLDGSSRLTPVEAAQVLAPADEDGLMAAVISVGLVGSRAQENVEAVRDLLEPLVADLDAELAALHPRAQATLTGTPIVRQASLDAVVRSLRVSLPIAVLLCLVCAWGFMRSLRHALVSLVPILLVVAWLYGFMRLAGFGVNLVTATIGAISIGIGIDFSTHMTMRYREELAGRPGRVEALRAATAGTGMALVGSSVSSIAGFVILAFAPMPMFASFGLLTAVMIALALAATLLVLPGLLLLVSDDPRTAPPVVAAPATVAPRPLVG